MIVLDPGHAYKLKTLDGDVDVVLTFVKREGEGYPGNVGSYPGTNIQEVLRALIHRVKYLESQISDIANAFVLADLRNALKSLEWRAARRHNRPVPYFDVEIETMTTCESCGHIGCNGACLLK